MLELLMAEREAQVSGPAGTWAFIGAERGRTLDIAAANQYLLYCLLEFQMKVGVAERSARRVIARLGCPAGLVWSVIASMDNASWLSLCREERIHRFADRTGRAVGRVAGRMVRHVSGDARNVWKSGSPGTTLDNLEGVLRVGPQLSRMCVLGLLENGLLDGDGDVKADVHVRRVVGRLIQGHPFAPRDVAAVQSALASIMPAQKWKLDLPLWTIGRRHCHADEPRCADCPLLPHCCHANQGTSCESPVHEASVDTPRSIPLFAL